MRTPSATAGRVVSLDGLRGVAALGIAAFHIGVPGLRHGGYWMMDVFFVLSGFLITGVLLGEREATGHVGLGRFYARRALRLYPALLAMVLVLMPLGTLLVAGGEYGRWLRDAVLSITYTIDVPDLWGDGANGALSHTWSLAIEEQFYLLWAPALVLLARRRAPSPRLAGGVLLTGCALFLLAVLVHRQGISARVIYGRPDLRFAELLLGAALGIALATLPRPLPARARRALPVLGAVAAAGLALMAVAMPVPDAMRPITFAALLPVAAFGAAAVVLTLATDDESPLARLLRWRVLVTAGVFSYGIYLWHLPVLILVRRVTPDLPTQIVLAFAGTLAAAYASRRLVEEPFLALKHRLRATGVAGLEAVAEPVAATVRPDAAPARAPALGAAPASAAFEAAAAERPAP